jgi:hypothetical protein
MIILFILFLIVAFACFLIMVFGLEDGEMGLGCGGFIFFVIFGLLAYITMPEGLIGSEEEPEEIEQTIQHNLSDIEKGLIFQRKALGDTMSIELEIYRLEVKPANLLDSKSDSVLKSWNWEKDTISNSYFYEQ